MAAYKNSALRFEQLENRLLQAANPVTVVENSDYLNPLGPILPPITQVSATGTTVRIECGNQHDKVQVQALAYTNGGYYLRITNNIQTTIGNNTGIRYKKEVFEVDCRGIRNVSDPKIVFLGNGGDDYFEYRSTLFDTASDRFHIFADGGEGKDNLWGNTRSDILIGGSGNDWLRGEGGDDILFGGDGVDNLRGGPGNDMLFGGAGKDNLHGDGPAGLWHSTPGERDGNDIVEGGQDGVSDQVTGGLGRNLYVNDLAPIHGVALLQNIDTPYRTRGEQASFTNNSLEAAVSAVFSTQGLSSSERLRRLKGSQTNRLLDDVWAQYASNMYSLFAGNDFHGAFRR